MTSSTLPGRHPGGPRARFPHPLSGHTAARLGSHLHGADRTVAALLDHLAVLARRYAPTMLRCSLALVFVWFGALKLMGNSPVFALIGATLPWFAPQVTVPVVGAVEVALGLGLLVPPARRLVLLALVGHLCGTFLTFAMAPQAMFRGDPLLLTASGEFVLKNLVLISAVLVLLGATKTARDSHTG